MSASDPETQAYFGNSVAIDGSVLIVGAQKDDAGASDDCQPNCIPDECELASQTSEDCNGNTVLDECDIADGSSMDCNLNGDLDSCELSSSASSDCDADVMPNGCSLSLAFPQPIGLGTGDVSTSVARDR